MEDRKIEKEDRKNKNKHRKKRKKERKYIGRLKGRKNENTEED